jgi:iron complex outermembrane receptor protein
MRALRQQSSISRTIARAALARVGLFALIAPLNAHAQDAAATQQQAAPEGQGLAEIVVTAQKRSEKAQNVPIAITALSSGDLKAAGLSSTQDLRAAVPALNFTTGTGGYGLPRIRGIGATGQGPGIENPVAVYVDGVYLSSASAVLQSMFDTKQVAVLKGPQGTLFGRNATGGLIQITTEGPSSTWTSKGEIGYGNYNTFNAAGYLSGPLAQNLSFSVSGQYEKRAKGFGKNVVTGNDIQTSEQFSGRAKLLWTPGVNTSVLVAVDTNGRNAVEPAFANFGLNTLGQNVPAMIAAAGGNPQRDIYADSDPLLRTRQSGVSLTAEQDLGGAKLKSITAYRSSKIRDAFDPDGTAMPFIRVDNNEYDRQFTQEVNLTSTGNGKLQWVLGGFYMWDSAGAQPDTVTGIYTFGNNGSVKNINNVRLSSISAFAEGTYTLAPDTHFIAGIRYTSDVRDLFAVVQSYNGNIGTTTSSGLTTDTHTFNQATWRLSLDHRFSPQVMAYASYNRGFRSGSYIAQSANNGVVPLLRPEQVDAFEGGLKTDLFDRKVRLNLSGYYYNEKNIQVMQVISGVQNVYNAQGAHIYGLDADITWKLADHLRLFGGVNWTHARYTQFTDAVLSIPYPVAAGFNPASYTYLSSKSGAVLANTGCLGTQGLPTAQLGGNCLIYGDASGHKLQNTPDVTFSMGGAWDLPTPAGKFTLAGNVYYNGGYVGAPDGRVQQPHYTLVDSSLTWRLPNDHLYVRGWGRNLTNAFYRTQIGSTNSGDNGTTGAPRTYGITLGWEY